MTSGWYCNLFLSHAPTASSQLLIKKTKLERAYLVCLIAPIKIGKLMTPFYFTELLETEISSCFLQKAIDLVEIPNRPVNKFECLIIELLNLARP